MLCIFFIMRYATFLDVFQILVGTNKTLAVFGDLLQCYIKFILEFIKNPSSDFCILVGN